MIETFTWLIIIDSMFNGLIWYGFQATIVTNGKRIISLQCSKLFLVIEIQHLVTPRKSDRHLPRYQYSSSYWIEFRITALINHEKKIKKD